MTATITAGQKTRLLASRYLGREISDEEYPLAKEQAERKLSRIIQREGDADGERQKPYYLAQLIAEAIRENAFSAFTRDIYDTIKYAEEQWRKKKCPQPKPQGKSKSVSLLYHNFLKMQ